MSLHQPSLHDCAQQNCTEISKYMPVTRWKAIKAAGIALILASVGVAAIVFNGDPTAIGLTTIVAILVAAGADVKEVQIAKVVSLTFRNGGRKREDDQE